ncbi:MAG TPA: helix-turn-helix domain-containing protein [Myxococcaceae bacterium]|nr:helix-turn-helix domain-containing protein [Myxococcaceae bacterium]
MVRTDSKVKFLDAALRLIRTQGYEATTVDELCAAAGMTKGSFFHHFESKEALALAAADYFAAFGERVFESAPYRQAPDALDRVLGYVDFRASLMRGALPDFTCLLGMMVQETYHTHPDIRRACDRHISDHAQKLAVDLAEAKQRYAPQAPWAPDEMALFVMAVIHGAFILAKAKQAPEVAVANLTHLRRYLETQFTRSST